MTDLIEAVIIGTSLVGIALAGAVFVAIWQERPRPQRDPDGTWRMPRPGRRR